MPLAHYPWDVVEIPTHTDAAGSITMADVGKEVPFPVRNLYWIHDVTLLADEDGGYASFHTNQLMVPLVGGCEVRLSDGVTHRTVELETQPFHRKTLALWCKPGSWRELVSPQAGTVLLVLSDQTMAETRFVRNWADFLVGVGRG